MSEPIKMRTRLLSKMTNYEVEEYLDRNSIIFVPVGTVEVHGNYSMDVEYTGPAGLSLAMAEKVDGLVFDSLKYFYAGATSHGRGTVQVDHIAGYNYLKTIIRSLWCQGFKEIILVSGHGPAEKTIVPVIWDFFDETKHHCYWMDHAHVINYVNEHFDPEKYDVDNLDLMSWGFYEILNCKDDIVIDPTAPAYEPRHGKFEMPSGDWESRAAMYPEACRNFLHAMDFATFGDATGWYMSDLSDHGGTDGVLQSIEERDRLCAEGLKQLRVAVEIMDMPRYIEGIRKQQVYTDTVLKAKYHHLPKNLYHDWN